MIYKNPLSTYKTVAEKEKHFLQDCNKENIKAYSSDRKAVPLRDLNVSEVEFIGGLWRIQDDFKYDITFVRDRNMVLGPQMPRKESNHFVYYNAAPVEYNCYGPFVISFDMIVAKYTTGKNEYWAYGKSIAEARAFLGIKIMDLKEKQK